MFPVTVLLFLFRYTFFFFFNSNHGIYSCWILITCDIIVIRLEALKKFLILHISGGGRNNIFAPYILVKGGQDMPLPTRHTMPMRV